MPTVTSADGTTIAYECSGSGPAIVLVDGAMCYRAAGPMRPLAKLLKDHVTVYTYDRRGRGESGDTAPYAVEREVEDLRAIITVAGGRAHLYAMSSGGAVALATAVAERGVSGLALYEPPYLAGIEESTRIRDYTARLREVLAAGRNGDAVALFMANIGMHTQAIDHLRLQPGWATLEAIAPTLAYDDALLAGGGVPHDLTSAITVPTVVMAGKASPPGLQQAAKETAAAIPTATLRRLHDQTHDVDPAVLAPVLVEILGELVVTAPHQD
jgi:pimeloyl-ACP methyl ester carboxylesterase